MAAAGGGAIQGVRDLKTAVLIAQFWHLGVLMCRQIINERPRLA
jgi:hypothetical protein